MITVIFLQPVELKDSVIFRSINLPEHVFDNLSRKSLISFSTLEESNLVITLTLSKIRQNTLTSISDEMNVCHYTIIL